VHKNSAANSAIGSGLDLSTPKITQGNYFAEEFIVAMYFAKNPTRTV